MAGRPTRLRNDRAHQAKPYEKRTSVLQSMVSAVRALIPSFLSESASESEAAEQLELPNGDREQPPWVVPVESPRLMRDCAVGTDNEDELEPINFSLSSPPPPERPLERPPERPLERPPATPSPSSWMSLAASSHKRPKLYHEESPLQSPFYSGQTTYGGAAAQNRLRLLAASQTPAVPVVVRGVKSGGATSGLSNTTRHMLATLEKMATPVAEAKRVPLHRRVPSTGRPWNMQTPSPTLAQGGPPVRGAARPTMGWAAQQRLDKSRLSGTDGSRVESPRADTARVEASRVEAPRLEAPRLEAPRLEASRLEAPKPSVPPQAQPVQEPQQTPPAAPKVEASRVSAPPSTLPAEQKLPSIPWEPPPKLRAADRTSGGGKMVRVIHTACHPAPIRVGGPPAEPETELPPAVSLPPMKSLPSFSFCLKPQEPASSLAGASTSSAGSTPTSPPQFSFSKPEPIGEASTLSHLPPKADQAFTFSEPWGPYDEEEGQMGKDKASMAAPQGTPKMQDAASSAKVVPPATAASPGMTSSTASVHKKAEDAEKKVEASKTTDSTKDGTTKGSGDLWERFKPPAGSWSCSTCMLSNPSSAVRCQACEEPKPGTAAPPATAPPPPAPAAPAALPPLAAVAASQAALWECDTCLVRNQPGAQRCCACETPRPSPANGLAASSAAAAAAAAAFSFTLAPAKPTGFGGAPFQTGDGAAKPIKFGISTLDGPAKPAEPSATAEAPAKTPFKFGITAGVPIKPAEPVAATRDPAKAPVFGTGADDVSKPFKGASKTLKFVPTTEESAKALFKLGAAAEPPKVPAFGAATEDPAKTVQFGSALAEPAKGIKRGATAEEPPKFSFGSPADQPATGFKLGGAAEAKSPQTSAAAAEATAPAFKFGSSQVEPAKAAQLGPTTGDAGFKFGSEAKEPAKPFAFGSTPQQATTGFKFGSGLQEPAKQPFSFGSSEEPQPAKAFKFGAASDEPAKAFQFGAATTEPSKFGPGADTAAKSPLFTFGSPAATSTAVAAPAPFTFGMADKPGNTAAAAAAEPCAVAPLASGQDAGNKTLAGLLPAPAMPASMPSSEAPKPAFSSPFVFGAKTESVASTPSSFMFGGQQPPPAYPTPNGGAATASLTPFGTLQAKQPEPPQPTQPLFGAATTAFTMPTLKPTVTSTVAGFGSGFAPSVPAAPGQSSFVFRPQTTAPPATFQFGSTGPTSSSVFRFGAQPSQPAGTLQQQQPQQPASEGFAFPQPNTMGFSAPSQQPPFPIMMDNNPFSATGTGGGPSQQQRRIRKAVRRTKPNAR
ncbi:uncharacterized protein LOC144159420 isoform X2 [Haemaphysalis longicornis]